MTAKYEFLAKTKLFLDNTEIETTTSHNLKREREAEELKFCNGMYVEELGTTKISITADVVLDTSSQMQLDIFTGADEDRVYTVKEVYIEDKLYVEVPCKVKSFDMNHTAGQKVKGTIEFAPQGPAVWTKK